MEVIGAFAQIAASAQAAKAHRASGEAEAQALADHKEHIGQQLE